MDKPTRNAIERATQQARKLLDEDFSSQLEGTFDVLPSGVIALAGGVHLSLRQRFQREKIVAAIEHKRTAGTIAVEAVTDYVRDAAFTTLNRFVALKMLEARQLVQECITKGEQSAGYREFCGMAPGLALVPDAAGYRLYVESLFDEFSTEIKVLFDRRDAPSVLWPKRQTFEGLLTILNTPELAGVWGEDETIGWVYQFFNSGEERRKMRDESQAPRNSRELAVRNQFFTPRYVVQFLVDNTLGRLWLEMHGERTSLVKLCEYLVRSVEEPSQPRLRKDPRDLRILDPACGSGHFLLYSFDLLLAIYEEAWAAEGPAPSSEATGRSLREDYPDLEELRRVAPRLIVESNLHGVDIDPRCAQIAALALWLRAQRAWKDIGIAASDRPRIQHTHIVVAEPMPGDAVLVDEFAARLDPPLLRDLFKKMVGESRLAGELGALLRVEDGIATELRRAREQFVKQRQTTAFLPGMEPVAKQGSLDLSGIDDDEFFHEAEVRIVEALRVFAETATGSASVRRRLFAGDAAQGVALIDLVRTRFDIVLMNPPFGSCSVGSKREFEASYPRTKNDVYAAFVERGVQLLHPNGLLGAITSRTGFFLSSFQKWREEVLLKEAPPVVFADLGYGVLDSAMVEVAAYCLEKSRSYRTKTAFLRSLESDDKAATLLTAIKEPYVARGRQRFEVDPRSFGAVPRSPFAYWVSEGLIQKFRESDPVESGNRTAKIGPSTGDDGRYVRCWWEIDPKNNRSEVEWVPFAKGGSYSPYYADVYLVISWGSKRNTFFGFTGRVGRETERPNSLEFFRRPGITWPLRTQVGLALRAMPAGCIFGHKGPTILVVGDDPLELLSLLGVSNSKAFRALVDLQMAFGSYEVGVIQRTPIPNLTQENQRTIATLSRRAWSLKRGLDQCSETSHAFLLPALLLVDGEGLAERANSWMKHVRAAHAELVNIDREIDARCFDLYRIASSDQHAINEGFARSAEVSREGEAADAEGQGEDDEEEAENGLDPGNLAADLTSWAVSVAFGRFDLRLATGERASPEEHTPFSALPVCSSAMLFGDDGLPLRSAPSEYAISLPENGVLVDDPGHSRDLTMSVRRVFEAIFKASADEWWNQVGALLDPKDHDLRKWLVSDFFERHLKRHSKSRRKAPIVWHLAIPSVRYGVWLYALRLTKDSLFQIQNDVVAPKLAHEEQQRTNLVLGAGANPSAKDRKEIAEQEVLVDELRAFLDEVKRVAPLWNPVLDDGVLLTMAPLWRLVPQHKPWQRELKSKWDELVAGKYDWSHAAMHLWPERVIAKCVKDRSLAIAHGLEDVFWVEAGDGKWEPRSNPKRPVDELVRERTSIAVKAALRGLTEASAPNGPKTRTRRTSS